MNRINDTRGKRKRPTKKLKKLWEGKKLKQAENQNISAQPSSVAPVDEPLPSISSASVSTSEKKLSLFSVVEDERSDSNPSDTNDYMIVHKNIWEQIFSGVACGKCGSLQLILENKQMMGYAAKLLRKCTSCGDSKEFFTSPRLDENTSSRPPFEVNRKMVNAFLSIGKGHYAMEQFSMEMGMPKISGGSYNQHLHKLNIENCIVTEEVLGRAHKAIREAHREINPDVSEGDVIDITVSYDGTWQKRGHTSLYGIGIVIDVLTGLVVDFEVLSKFCNICAQKTKSVDKKNKDYSEWKKNHIKNGECDCNFAGSSNSMEVAAAEILWKRSILKCNMRYTSVLSDGDAKTHKHLEDMKVYGSDVSILKEECINHVSKRLRTGLKNIVSEWRVKGVTLGGKKPGSLKEETMIKLTNYYRNAIKQNIPNIENMKSAVFATLYHCGSTDDQPMHFKCPGGEMSWCFYNRALAKGEQPPMHDKTTMKTTLTMEVVKKVIPLYKRLGSEELLRRCTSGKTQNSNESLHSVIWNKCPKEIFVSKKKIVFAVTSAIAEFNMGCQETQKLKSSVSGISISASGEKISKLRDERRLQRSAISGLQGTKTARRNLKLGKMAEEQRKTEAEGPMYGAGEF